MDILSFLQLLGGIGLFLYGMSLMGSSLEKLAGSGLERILERLTTDKRKGIGYLKGFGLGAGVTAIIQSSAATTIMLIGFVNAGIMKLFQAIPVVMGANVGSTVTAQILRLGDLGSDNLILKLLKPASFAPMLVGIGAFILLFTKDKKAKHIAGILVGMGILFYGMTTMEEVFAPLKDSEAFQKAFTSFRNPLLGILIGLVITAIIQSSSASVGILQALSATGSVSYATAVPIIIGQNLGKCMTILLGAIGANKKAKRVSLSYLLFNIFGAVIFVVIYFVAGIGSWDQTVNRGDIANVHLLFNLLTGVLLLPFSEQIGNLTGRLTGDDEVSKSDQELSTLDEMLLNTPTIALEQCKHVISAMADAIYENYQIATELIRNYDPSRHVTLEENENFIDRCESALSSYVIKINSKRLSKDNRLVVSEILNSISDFERMGDHCINIFYVAQHKSEEEISFSPEGQFEIDMIIEAVDNAMRTTFEAFKNDNVNAAVRIEPLAEMVDKLKETIKAHHVDRLQNGTCGIPGGIALVDLVTSFERITSHCANIALHIVKRVENHRDFDDMHGHANDSYSEEYKALYHYYESQYITPVINGMPKPKASDTVPVQVEAEPAAANPSSTKKSKKDDQKISRRGKPVSILPAPADIDSKKTKQKEQAGFSDNLIEAKSEKTKFADDRKESGKKTEPSARVFSDVLKKATDSDPDTVKAFEKGSDSGKEAAAKKGFDIKKDADMKKSSDSKKSPDSKKSSDTKKNSDAKKNTDAKKGSDTKKGTDPKKTADKKQTRINDKKDSGKKDKRKKK